MPISNFPSGFSGGVSIRGLPLINSYGGKVFWVDSGGGSNAYAGTHVQPYATIEKATSACTDNNGDIVMVKAGHSETFSAAASSSVGWEADKKGVTYVGLGTGNDRPTFILDTAVTTDINVSGTGSSIHNMIFEAAYADIEKMIHLTTDYVTIDNCSFREQTSGENWVLLIDADGTTNEECSYLHFTNNVVIGADAANTDMIQFAADTTGVVVADNYIELGVGTGNIIDVLTGKDARSIQILRNNVYRLQTSGSLMFDADTGAANTGVMAYNTFGHADTAGEVWTTTTTRIMPFENYGSAAVDKSGYILPSVDS
jgi:hypothetical protein